MDNPPTNIEIVQLQGELDGVRKEIEQIRLQCGKHERNMATLSTQLEDALAQAEIAAQNVEMQKEINRLQNELRDAREEGRNLNDELRKMMKRETSLVDELSRRRRHRRVPSPSPPRKSCCCCMC